MTVINAQDRFRNKETTFWKEYNALSGVLTINEALALYYPHTSAGKAEKPVPFNCDF